MAAVVAAGSRINMPNTPGTSSNDVRSGPHNPRHVSLPPAPSPAPSAFSHRPSSSQASISPPTKTFKGFRTSLQETLRQVSSARKGKGKEKDERNTSSPPPSAFIDKARQISGLRRSLDSHDEPKDVTRKLSGSDKEKRRSFDALTQKSTTTSLASQSGSDRDRDKTRPRVLRKPDHRAPAKRSATSPTPQLPPERNRNSLLPSPIPPSPSPPPSPASPAHLTGPGWAPFVTPTLSKGSMSSPHLTLGRTTGITDCDDPDLNLKPSSPRRQRSPLTSIGAFLPRTRKLSLSVTPSKPLPKIPTKSPPVTKPTPPSSKPPKPTRSIPPPLTISRPKAMLAASPSTPTLIPSPSRRPVHAKSDSTHHIDTASPPPGNDHPAPNDRAPPAPSTPKNSRIIGMGHPSTSTRRLGTPSASKSTSNLPINPPLTPPTPTTPTPVVRSPTASTSASRARAVSPISIRPTSPNSVRTSTPTSPTRRTSPSPSIVGLSPKQPVSPLRSASASNLPLAPSPPGSPRLVPRRASHGHSSSVPMASLSRTRTPSPSPSLTPPTSHRSMSISVSPSPGREIIRRAANALVKEMVHRRHNGGAAGGGGPALSKETWEEVENRIRGLARIERMWSRNGAGGVGAEDREKKIFGDALRDGYVLCQFMNHLRPGSITKVDASGNTNARATNVSKFLLAAAAHGVSSAELFIRQDLADGSTQGLARVAGTVLALVGMPTTQVYKGSASTPNLLGRPTSPTSPLRRPTSPLSAKQKRWSPPSPALATVRSDSPEDTKTVKGGGRTANDDEADDVFGPMEFTSDASPVARVGPRISTASRSSVASSSLVTETTTYSSLLEHRASARFGTIRTITTEATSGAEAPSLTRTEGSAAAQSIASDEVSSPMPRVRAKRPSLPNGGATPDDPPQSPRWRISDNVGVVDLTRVAEETDGEGSIARRPAVPPRSPARNAVQLGKGVWPDDFINAFQYPARSSPVSIPEPDRQRGSSSLDLPREPGTPELRRRRPSRNSTDMLLPKEAVLGREPSPVSSLDRESSTPSPGGVGRSRQSGLRRTSTRTYVPRNSSEEPAESGDAIATRVPFPSSRSPSADGLSGSPVQSENLADRMAHQRTRHRSDNEKLRRSSFGDQPGTRLAARSRYESMVNLGSGGDGGDFPKGERGGMEGRVRKILVVKEEGKPATNYQLGNCIGRGQFGSVYRAMNLNTGQMVAVKRVRLEGLSEKEVSQLMDEVELMKRLSHPSIIKYEGVARDSDTLNIVLEYAENGSLAQTLKAFGKLNEKLVASYVTKVLEGLHYLHRSQVVHCDLKAANILTTKNGNVKLSDFGVSLNLRAMEHIKNDVAGTPNWMAPEVIELKGAQPASDIWSLACTIIELLTGRPPYADVQNGMSVMFRIVEDSMPPIPEGLSEPLEEFLRLCFRKDPKDRPDAETLFEHPWLKRGWGAYKELRPQDSIPFLRRVSADLQRSDVRQLIFTEEDGTPSPQTSEPRPHSFVKTNFAQPVTCRICNQPVKRSAAFCTECSLIAHWKCANEALQTCDIRAQVRRLSQDMQREVVSRQQSPTPTPTSNTTPIMIPSSSPPKQIPSSSSPKHITTAVVTESPVSSSPSERFRIFGRKKSKTLAHNVETVVGQGSMSPGEHKQQDESKAANKRGLFGRPRTGDDKDRSRSRASIISSHPSSTRSGATPGGSLSSATAEARLRRESVVESDVRSSRATDSSLVGEVLMSADAAEEAYLRRRGTRREKRDSDASRSGCVVQ